MKVSFLLVTRNTRALLVRALESIEASRDPFEKEVIVIDNGSTDDTATVVSSRFPSVIYRPSPHNLGFSRANNLAASEATGDFLCLLNSDARLKENSLTLAVTYLETNPQVGLVGVQLLNTDGTRQNSIANFPTLATELLNKSLLRRLFPSRYPGKNQVFSGPTEVESVIGAFLLVRRSLWEQLGGLDESYFFFLEETDFCLRCRKLGFGVKHLPHVEVWHDQGGTAKKVNVRARIEYWISRYRYFQQHHNSLTRGLLRFGLVLRLPFGFIANGVLAPFGPKFRSKAALYGALLLWHVQGCPTSGGLRGLESQASDRARAATP
jgi:GT2 family glycosyltransferase